MYSYNDFFDVLDPIFSMSIFNSENWFFWGKILQSSKKTEKMFKKLKYSYGQPMEDLKKAKIYGEFLVWKIFGWKPAWNTAAKISYFLRVLSFANCLLY